MSNILIGNIIDECITVVIQKKLNTLNRVYGALNTTIDKKKSPMLRPKCHSRYQFILPCCGGAPSGKD